jgi:hypothetical protein
MSPFLEDLVNSNLADALVKNNPEIARTIDDLVKHGQTVRQIKEYLAKKFNMRERPVFFQAISAYAQRAINRKDKTA